MWKFGETEYCLQIPVRDLGAMNFWWAQFALLFCHLFVSAVKNMRLILYQIYNIYKFSQSRRKWNISSVLQFVIDELKGTSVVANDLISNAIRINVSCNQCFSFSAKGEKLDILTIPLSPNINSSLSKFLKPEILESENKWFCPSCNWKYHGIFHHWFGFYFSDPA